MALNMAAAATKLQFVHKLPLSSSTTNRFFKPPPPVRCAPVQQQQLAAQEEDEGAMCESCNGKGWLLCDFCNGQKTNVKGSNNRIYRRCPSCRAVGCVLCQKCKVFKCITFPDYNDGEDILF